jgi:hypothetical protein
MFRVTKRTKNYDPIFVGLVVLWAGYQAQSIISINQIGLAVWGWLLNGLAIAYEKNTRTVDQKAKATSLAPSTRKRGNLEIFSPQLVAGIGLIVGFVLAAPPMSADMKWAKVQKTRQLSDLEVALAGGYLTPSNSQRLASVVVNLEESQLPEYAIKYARMGVNFNPENFDAWKVLYYSTKSTAKEKAKAKAEMIRLDPLNNAWKEID